ncbi:MAG: ArsR/SmtB family transcription factor [Planctomycetota bacterium]|jgi:DNA-binding transcriptional ArsR family regulator
MATQPKALPAACKKALKRHLQPDVFRALGDPSRIALVARLAAAGKPVGVSALSECCGVHLSGVSRHLATLRDAGLIAAERRGREVLYRLEIERVTSTLRGLADALDDCRTHFCC